jgi:hypothetical protein
MFSIRHLVAVALIASFCSTSSASVTYSFSGFFGANLPDGWQDATATFSLTLPDVISSDFTIPVESMTACSTPYSTCLEAKFDMSAQQAGLTDKPDMQALELSSDSGTIYYYFSPDTFTTTGQHTTLDIGSPGTITISSSVPESSTMAYMLLGLSALALSASKRNHPKRVSAASCLRATA